MGFKFGQIIFSFFLGGGGGVEWESKTGSIFLRLRKATATVLSNFFTSDFNVIFMNYCVPIARKICNTATPVHGAMAKFPDR